MFKPYVSYIENIIHRLFIFVPRGTESRLWRLDIAEKRPF